MNLKHTIIAFFKKKFKKKEKSYEDLLLSGHMKNWVKLFFFF